MNTNAYLSVAFACLLIAEAGAEDLPIAGLAPDVRPAGMPRLETHIKDAGWYRQALTGVSRPYPYSLRFLENQGGWHTPFIVPGMTGPYDIRNWHLPAQAGGHQGVARR
ncbi:MAG TPA: hypothetical protein PLW81_13260 [Thiobacillaceae bacterium]|nr:hypothetical protein [Thiobacillaceae bacterium]